MFCTARSIASETKSCSVAVRLVSVERVAPQPASNNAQVASVSVDSPYSHQAWSKADLKEQRYPMLSDLNHAISTAYGCYLEDKGIALRATYIVDPEGTLQWAEFNPLNVGRNADEILRVLTALQTGELCQAGWKPGDQTLSAKLGKK